MQFPLRPLLVAALAAGIGGGTQAATTKTCSTALVISARSGRILSRPNLPVYSAVSDGRGGWYVADIRLRRVKRAGSIDGRWPSPFPRTLPPGPPAAFAMLARHGDRVYLAGQQRV